MSLFANAICAGYPVSSSPSLSQVPGDFAKQPTVMFAGLGLGGVGGRVGVGGVVGRGVRQSISVSISAFDAASSGLSTVTVTDFVG